MPSYEVSATPARPVMRRRTLSSALAGRLLDVAISSLLLLALLPVLAAIALAIRVESKGSPVFRQRRVGLDGRTFLVNKFRSMRVDADEAKHRSYVQSLIAHGAEGHERDGLYKLAVDDRVTRVGRFIRKWSLDELPQLWNVLRGEMSLVGPRPVIPYEVAEYPAWYMGRFAVKPGLTGLWQVSGRNERTYEEMIELDCRYAREHTLWLDIRILFRTVVTVLRRQGVA